MSILHSIILIFSCLLLVNSLEIERRKYGDRLTNGSICHKGTYVIKQNVAPTLHCESRMYEAGCDWAFEAADAHRVGFVPKETFKSPNLRVKLLKMAYFPDGNCSNHSIGRIDAQNIGLSGVAVWDSIVGENINMSLIYQFNYAGKFVNITFTKHWDGMLIKLFINCLDETGENIRKYAETRCVMIKYEGNITYPFATSKGTTSSTTPTSPTSPTSPTATTEAKATTARPTTSKTTDARKTVTGTATAETTNARLNTSRVTNVNRTNTTHMPCVNISYKSSHQRENVLIGVICTLGGLILIQFLVVYVGIKRNLLLITINWKNKENQSNIQEDAYDVVMSPTSNSFPLSKPDKESQNYTELSLSQKDVIQSNYASLCKDNQSYGGYETTSRYK